MEKSRVVVSFVLLFLLASLAASTIQLSPVRGSSVAVPLQEGSPSLGGASSTTTAAVSHPLTTFPRTVLIETFTAVWCIHCPAESAALYAIDHSMNKSVVDIAELHVCAYPTGSGPCLENYVPPDGTSNLRGTFYNVCGFPDVFFDGGHPSCGASNSESQMQGQYASAIANASAIPGNVSIADSASISAGTVVEHSYITSALTGSYNAVSYLLEYIGKTNVSNGYGPHDLGNVVRLSMFNHPVALVNGGTIEVNSSVPLNSSWNPKNLSVVTFVQQNSTKIVENADLAPVSTLASAVSASVTAMPAENISTLTLHVTNGTSSAAVSGASVTLSSSAGGSFSPASGVTGSDGTFVSNFTAPMVTSTESILITAQVSASGYIPGSAQVSIEVTPLVAPSVPTSLQVTPTVGPVTLTWSPPLSGGTGVSYTIYRADSLTSGLAQVGVSSTTSFIDSSAQAGQSYWYEINAHGPGGFSGNTSAVSATSVAAVSQGLPASMGWWLTIGTSNFNSTTNASLNLYLPAGYYTYEYGPYSYAYVAAGVPTPFTVAGTSWSFDATFTPRWATLEGTVAPVGASVTLNGTAISVVNGSFVALRAAGSYTLAVTSEGYQSSSVVVNLTPGNVTTKNVLLKQTSSGSGSQASTLGGLSSDELLALVVAVVVFAGVLGTILVMSKRKGRGRPPGNGDAGTP
jgi:hypothetical protein